MRQATPDLLAAQPAPSPTYDLAAAMVAPAPELVEGLRYDYAALGETGESIRQHALAIKSAERRMGEATVEAGKHLIAVRGMIPHGHWLTWLADEFGMSDDAAQVTMNVARRFGAKTESIRYLSPTVLGLLAAKSVPDEAVDAAIAASTTEAVTVRTAKAIIAAHRPAPLRQAQGKCRKCGRPLTDPDAIRNGIGACCAARMARGGAMGDLRQAQVTEEEDRPLPAWATVAQTVADVVEVYGGPTAPAIASVSELVELAPAPSPAPPQGDSATNGETCLDPRAATLARLALQLEGLREEMRQLGDEYGKVTGDFTTPLEIRHKIERMQVQVKREQGGWE